MKRKIHTKGVTLIEVVIYIALFGILLGGTLVSVFNLFENAGRIQTQSILEEEGNFIISKIQWAISGANGVNLPDTYGSILSVNKVTSLDSNGLPVVSVITISLPTIPGNVMIKKGTEPEQALNNSNVQVKRLGFFHTLPTTNGINPESIEASTTIEARTPNGMIVSRDFETTVYLKR